MIERDNLIRYLNEYLSIGEFSDYGPQGLQVEGKAEVQKIVIGVSACAQLFMQAIQAQADMIIVHHGILWDRESHVVKGWFKNRLSLLLQNDITLLAYHLPLDKHPVVGNNAVAAREIGLSHTEDFSDVGIKGLLPGISFEELVTRVQKVFKSDPIVFPYGPEIIEKAAICSGGAEREIVRAIDEGLDAYITGEVSEPIMNLAREGNIHFVAAGHHATERLGIRALGDHIAESFDVQVEFIDVPNPV